MKAASISEEIQTATARASAVVQGVCNSSEALRRAISCTKLMWQVSIAIASRDQRRLGPNARTIDLAKTSVDCNFLAEEYAGATANQRAVSAHRGSSPSSSRSSPTPVLKRRKSTRASKALESGGS